MDQDSIAGSYLRMNTQRFAILESVFFGLGIVFVAAIVTVMWSKTTAFNTYERL